MSLYVSLDEGICPTCGASGEVFDWNITHNLGKMAKEAGLYWALWRPEEIGITEANQMLAPLSAGLKRLVAEPEKYKAFNPENGWGDYEGLVKFVTKYLMACQDNPTAKVEVSR